MSEIKIDPVVKQTSKQKRPAGKCVLSVFLWMDSIHLKTTIVKWDQIGSFPQKRGEHKKVFPTTTYIMVLVELQKRYQNPVF